MSNTVLSQGELGDYFELRHGFAFPGSAFSDEGELLVVKIKNIKPGRLDLSKQEFIPAGYLATHGGYMPKAGDLLVSLSGNRYEGNPETWVGKVCLYTGAPRCLINQRVGILRKKEGVEVDSRYFSYLLSTLDAQQSLIQIATSSGGQANLSTKQLLDFEVLVAPPADQKAIAHILGTLDDKIELNRKTNETLEAMAKALFKSWFVDFDPVRAKGEGRPTGLPAEISDLFPDSFEDSELGQIPSGWYHRELQEVGSVIDPHPSHRAPQEKSEGFPFAGIGDIDEMGNINRVKARVVGEESVTEQENSYEVNQHSNGFGRVGTVGKVVRLRRQSFRFALSPTLAIVNPTNPCYAGLCFLLLRSPGFQSKVLSNMTGSTRPAIGIQILRKISTLLPPEDARAIYEHFESLTGGLIRKGDALNAQICLLTEARDALLLKLISGEIRIPDAEKMLEEVGI